MFIKNKSFFKAIFFFFTLIFLFLDFNTNFFNVVNKEWFVHHQLDAESFIMGRMVKSRRDGIFSSAGLVGLVSPNEKELTYEDHPFVFQYKAYLDKLDFNAYSTYNSLIGGQGMLFSFLDKIIPLSNYVKLKLFRSFNALLLALVLSLIIFWIYVEIDFFIAFFTFISIFFSQWIVVFARNLWWCLWVFFIPFLMMIAYLKKKEEEQKLKLLSFFWLVFIAVIFKCIINGFEYITTFLIMMISPIVYYIILYDIKKKEGIKLFIISILASFLAILFISIVLSFQISFVKGSFIKGIEHLMYSFQKRTYGNPANFPLVDKESLTVLTIDVLLIYFFGSFFDLNNYIYTSDLFVANFIFNIRYIYIIVFIFIATVALSFKIKNSEEEKSKIKALIFTTWFSFLAPISWFVIFKSHSFKHIHMNFIVWHMPFIIFGFILLGLFFKDTLKKLLTVVGLSIKHLKDYRKNNFL